MKNKILLLAQLLVFLTGLLVLCAARAFYSIVMLSVAMSLFVAIKLYEKKKYIGVLGLFLAICSGYTILNTSFSSIYTIVLFCICILSLFLMNLKETSKIFHYLFFIFALGFFIFSPSHQILFHSLRNPSKVSYLARGNWGVPQKKTDKLNIQSQYSYDVVRRLIGATPINDFTNISDYNEIWIVTPTKPFTQEELGKIKKWVARGGHLVVVSDHTDLFGHARVLSPLLASLGINIGNDCVIERSGKCTYTTALESYVGLTSNTFTGPCIMPTVFQLGFKEMTNYGNDSFFSDTQATAEDVPGIFIVAGRKSYGLGFVSFMGDSTLLANFSLAWPSSQKMLMNILNPHKDIPYYLLLALFLVLCSILNGTLTKKEIILGCIILAELSLLFMLSSRSFVFSPTDIRNETDIRLCEGSGIYKTLFASSFLSSNRFPVYSKTASSLDSFDLAKVNLPTVQYKRNNNMPLVEILNGKKENTVEDYLYFLIYDSQYESFWFDDGVGVLKEEAYKLFWSQVNAEPFAFCGTLGDLKEIKMALCKERGKKEIYVSYNYCALQGFEEDWVVVGDYILGKKVDDKILIKKKWQDSYWQFDDMILTVD